MNRRQLLTTLAAVPATAQLNAQPAPNFHFRAGLVAYSYRKELAAKSLSYEDLIRRIADWGLDGLDCTVYWFPDTSAEYLASLRKTAYKNGVQIYNAGVRVQLSQPTAGVAAAPSSTTYESGWMWRTGSAPATCASLEETCPRGPPSSRRSPGPRKC